MMLLQNTLPTKPHSIEYWKGLEGAAIPLVIAETAEQTKKPLCVLTPDVQSAQQLAKDLTFFSNSTHTIHILPDWETLPYDHFSPHQDIISERLATLHQLSQMKCDIVIVPITTAMHFVPPTTYVNAHSFLLKLNQTLDLTDFRRQLEHNGYHHVNQVIRHGEFSIRGSLIDIFPMGSTTPFRIDLFDCDVDSIRTFDPDSQRTLTKIDAIRVLPAREFPLNEKSIKHFRSQWRSHFSGNPLDCPIYDNISRGESAPGIEYYLKLFFESREPDVFPLANIFNYLPENTLIIRLARVTSEAQSFWEKIHSRYDQLGHDITRPLLPPSDVFISVEKCFESAKAFPNISFSKSEKSHADFSTEKMPDIEVNYKLKHPFSALETFLEKTASRTLFSVESPGRREALIELFQKIGIYPKVFETWEAFSKSDTPTSLMVTPLQQGVILNNLIIITENELFKQQVRQTRRQKQRVQDPEAVIRDLTELTIGSPVVHVDYGVGCYLGLEKLTRNDVESEYLLIEYANSAKLYVPITSLHCINRYTGINHENIPLNTLGTNAWQRAKKKAAEKIRDVAAELLGIYAERESMTSEAYNIDLNDYQRFAGAFNFEETPDQAQAIHAVLDDLKTEKKMDRLVCGDVGFGKTEVAMRAAFIAVQNNKQVALLVPTTVLAEQHFQNFTDRFADFPIRIEAISRFKTQKQQSEILEGVHTGKIDIIIGTHKLLQPNIRFRALGLLIIDEEHRFGVRHKEIIKAIKKDVDLLTLTATPIPRTLNMAMSGIRDLSIIATPPPQRLAVKTFVSRFNKSIIREAILRENLRGGQVYFLHNEVRTIQNMADTLQKLVPDARIGIAHGQIREVELERVMADFYHMRFNILVCTTIIESGIDVPTANTIIINRADKLGMAQLHQLRGRVGRSHHQAYAYLLTPDEGKITKDAERRLDALAAMDELGAGFTLATHDLEIRGAGELLGESQSGHIQTIGFSLYMEMLDHAVKALRSGKTPSFDDSADMLLGVHCEIDLQIPALIPDDYMPDVHMRLQFYKRIASSLDYHALDELKVELIDRFGLLPQQIKYLFEVTALKFPAQKLGVIKVDANPASGTITFSKTPQVDASKIIALIQKEPQTYQLKGGEKLRFVFGEGSTPDQRIEFIQQLFSKIA